MTKYRQNDQIPSKWPNTVKMTKYRQNDQIPSKRRIPSHRIPSKRTHTVTMINTARTMYFHTSICTNSSQIWINYGNAFTTTFTQPNTVKMLDYRPAESMPNTVNMSDYLLAQNSIGPKIPSKSRMPGAGLVMEGTLAFDSLHWVRTLCQDVNLAAPGDWMV